MPPASLPWYAFAPGAPAVRGRRVGAAGVAGAASALGKLQASGNCFLSPSTRPAVRRGAPDGGKAGTGLLKHLVLQTGCLLVKRMFVCYYHS